MGAAALSTPLRRAVTHPLPERQPNDLVRLPEVMRRTGLSRPTIYRKIAAGTFPAQVQLSVNCVGWYEGQLATWIADPTGWPAARAA